jgi:uridine kinase
MPGPGSGHAGPAAAQAHVTGAAAQVTSAARDWRTGQSRLVIAIDGHGGAGKSTIAGLVAAATGAAVVHTDDFFITPPRPASGRPGPAEAGPDIGCYYDWSRLRAEAVEPLRAGRVASFRSSDPEQRSTADGNWADGLVTVRPSALIVVEGVSSGAPALSGLVQRSVFVDTPAAERIRRLRRRVRPGEWDDEWLAAEQAYFSLVRPPSSFDLVVSGAGVVDGGAVTYV